MNSLEYVPDGDWDTVRLNTERTDVLLAQKVPQVTTLPSGQIADGTEIVVVADATNGVQWRFRYRAASASALKWEFIGGGSILSEVGAAEATSSITYAALGTAGPAVAIPLAGDYIVEIGAYQRGGAATVTAWMSYDIGGTGAVDADGAEFDSATTNLGGNVARTHRKNGLTAVTLTAKYRATSASGALFRDRFIRVTPVRVG